jgi:hypothetical protein
MCEVAVALGVTPDQVWAMHHDDLATVIAVLEDQG